ncbi:MAG: glycoside hydrolase family 2 TIM barrel-domain containing protein [Ferruginibacter sp.]
MKLNSRWAVSWLVRLTLIFSITVLITILFFYIPRGGKKYGSVRTNASVSIMQVNGQYNFFKDGKPFQVKGGAGFTYIKELAGCGGNTITCWDTSKLDITLKEAAKYNVSVIIGLDIPGGENTSYYENKKNITALYQAYTLIVSRYKDHPSLLAWSLGNELNFPFSLTATPFYKTYNRLLNMIQTKDFNHPVSTCVINIPKRIIMNLQWRVPALDFLCVNTYNGIKTLQKDLNAMMWVWKGPYLVSEWAPNGGWEAEATSWAAPIENTSTKKAEQYYELFTKYMPLDDPRFLGSLAFCWGSRQEYTYTWYSIFGEDGCPTEIKETLNDCWKDTLTKHIAPKLRYMLLDSLGSNDNIILKAGSIHNLSVLLEPAESASDLQYKWEILKEGWQTWGQTWNYFKKPQVEPGLIKDSSLQITNFVAPVKEGPYRVFVTVYNSKGHTATANTPIYVVK